MRKHCLLFVWFQMLVILNICAQQNAADFVENEYVHIQELTHDIELADTQESASVLNLYNERGLKYFFLGKFDDALDGFNHILSVLHDNKETEDCLFGAALWERFFCHAYLDQVEEAFEDLRMIRTYFGQDIRRCSSQNSDFQDSQGPYYILRIADFSNPDERISSAECRERVRGTINLINLLILKIPNKSLAAGVVYAISELESFANNCCDRSHWTECLNPVVDAWSYIKKCMDKSMKVYPQIISPGRY